MRPFYFYSKTTNVGQESLEEVKAIFGNAMSDMLYEIPKNSLVIPRFRAIPFGDELEREVLYRGSRLVNTYKQHRNIADIFNWVHLLEDITAPVYTIDDMARLPEGTYFIKGETNSKKNDWFNSAFCPDKKTLVKNVNNLLNDQYVGHQKIAIRPYQDFLELGKQVDGRPYFNERRVFVLDGKVLSSAFYWNSYIIDGGEEPAMSGNYSDVLEHAIKQTSDLACFYVIDLGQLTNGDWQVIELNDGSMSGLSMNSVANVFGKLHNELVKD